MTTSPAQALKKKFRKQAVDVLAAGLMSEDIARNHLNASVISEAQGR